MQKAGGPSASASPGPVKATINTTRWNIKRDADCDDACTANADEDCDGAAEEAKLTPSKGPVKTSASQNGQTLRHAINTKGTGATGRGAACLPGKDQSHDVHELEK